MNSALVMEYVQARMQELKVKSYSVRYRHVQVLGNASVTLEAYGELLILLTDLGLPPELKIESEYGHYNLGEPTIEQHHEFRGLVKITNLVARPQQLEFLQVIFKRKIK